MNKGQNNKLTGYKESLRVLNDYTSIWAENQVASEVVNQIKSNVDDIESSSVEKSKDTTGSTTTKNEQKETMARNASILAATGYAYAARIRNSTLQALFDYSFSALENVSDNVSIARCKAIHDALVPLLGDLANTGLGQADLTLLLKDIDGFKISIGYKSSAKNNSKTENRSLASLFDETDDLFTEQLDKLLLRYSIRFPEFHEEYVDSRRARNLGVRHEKEVEHEVK